eukprot:15430819-Alexandrium_andersonii.AAC.1
MQQIRGRSLRARAVFAKDQEAAGVLINKICQLSFPVDIGAPIIVAMMVNIKHNSDDANDHASSSR